MATRQEILDLQKQATKFIKHLAHLPSYSQDHFRDVVKELGAVALKYEELFQKQKDIIRDDRYIECEVCGISVHDEDATLCEKCDDGLERATCDECASQFKGFVDVEGDLFCKICHSEIHVKPIDREHRTYL